MNYEQFISEVQTYWDMRSKGLKKQANGFLSEFIKRFRENVSKGDADDILFTTMDDAIYMGMKNDVSFNLFHVMNIYEQQSTYNPNMGVRQLM